MRNEVGIIVSLTIAMLTSAVLAKNADFKKDVERRARPRVMDEPIWLAIGSPPNHAATPEAHTPNELDRSRNDCRTAHRQAETKTPRPAVS